MLSILQRLPLLPLNSSGILYPRNKSQELFPVNVEKVLVILKGHNSALGFQNLPVWAIRVANFGNLLLAEF